MTDVRCGACGYWLGEATEQMAYVEAVDKHAETKVSKPRDVRVCKSCRKTNVFIPRSTLDRKIDGVVGSRS